MSRDQKKGIGKRAVKSRRKQHIEINIAKADKVKLFILNIVLATVRCEIFFVPRNVHFSPKKRTNGPCIKFHNPDSRSLQKTTPSRTFRIVAHLIVSFRIVFSACSIA